MFSLALPAQESLHGDALSALNDSLAGTLETIPEERLAMAERDSASETLQIPMLTQQDSTELKAIELAASKKVKRDMSLWKPDPKRAMWLALVIPGAGQIYNRKYWKLPIVYGGFLGCAYAMRWNNQMYMDYSQAYLDIMDDDPTTKSYTQFLHLGAEITSQNEERYKQIFKSRKDKYRRWRDLSFFCMLGVYALSVIDAYVDAQMSHFDISDDLSLTVSPAVINGQSNRTAIGVQGALTF